MKLNAKKRKTLGKKVKSIRKNGYIPACVYGRETNSTPLMLEKREFAKVYPKVGSTTLIDLCINGEKPKKVLIHDVQRCPVSNDYLHVSFYHVTEDQEITISVPLNLFNEEKSKAVSEQGGVIVQPTTEIEIRCTPLNIPTEIKVDVKDLEIGDSIKLGDIKLPKGTHLVREGDKELVVAVGTTPTVIEEEKQEEEALVEEGGVVQGEAKEETTTKEGTSLADEGNKEEKK